MKIVKFYGVTNGKLDNPEVFKEDLKYFEGKRFKMTMDSDQKRTNPQNRYERGVIDKYIGNWLRERGNDITDKDVHEFLTEKYLGKIIVIIDGKEFERQKRFSDLDTVQFNLIKDKIQRDFAERGLIIPDPNEEDYRLGKEYQPPTED